MGRAKCAEALKYAVAKVNGVRSARPDVS